MINESLGTIDISPLRGDADKLGSPLLFSGSFLLFLHAQMSYVWKADRVAGQSVAAILFGKMQANRFR